MNAQELRELDAWIAENVIGNPQRRIRVTDGRKLVRYEFLKVGTNDICPTYTTDPAAAMEVLRKCAEKMDAGIVGIGSPMGGPVASTIPKLKQGWVVGKIGRPTNFDCEAATLELAICLFAKKLFTK